MKWVAGILARTAFRIIAKSATCQGLDFESAAPPGRGIHIPGGTDGAIFCNSCTNCISEAPIEVRQELQQPNSIFPHMHAEISRFAQQATLDFL
jgi:hypothetical protein